MQENFKGMVNGFPHVVDHQPWLWVEDLLSRDHTKHMIRFFLFLLVLELEIHVSFDQLSSGVMGALWWLTHTFNLPTDVKAFLIVELEIQHSCSMIGALLTVPCQENSRMVERLSDHSLQSQFPGTVRRRLL